MPYADGRFYTCSCSPVQSACHWITEDLPLASRRCINEKILERNSQRSPNEGEPMFRKRILFRNRSHDLLHS
jgi:hypothetical protein